MKKPKPIQEFDTFICGLCPEPHPELEGRAAYEAHMGAMHSERTAAREDGTRFVPQLEQQMCRHFAWRTHVTREYNLKHAGDIIGSRCTCERNTTEDLYEVLK